ncbi:MAG: hypothetical protein FJZ43_04120 [Candidatus Staskawiczbacteria bacterium]|nr:hypothetical protein [Candidatus Staskawiczbacteria bacterium]
MSTQLISTETQVHLAPRKFAMAEPSKLLTFLKGEPPVNAGKGRRRNPIISEVYNALIQNRNVWAHINVPITSKKELASIRASVYARAAKDNLLIQTSSLFNEKTKMYDFWVMLSNR